MIFTYGMFLFKICPRDLVASDCPDSPPCCACDSWGQGKGLCIFGMVLISFRGLLAEMSELCESCIG